ncbi:MAG TPA: hypothetical protein VF637_14200 [Sphingomicrobium sp.]|jgi:hypothetical protein
MALGALIAAYQEDDQEGLRALLPLAGQSLIEYQARCVAAAGAAPILVLVERIPAGLNEAFERLRQDGVNVIAVSDGIEAASRFEAGASVLLLANGIVPPLRLIIELADEAQPVVVTVADDEEHRNYERIDAEARWAGIAIIDGQILASTAAMLGDWDLQSTLLRRTLQEGAERLPVSAQTGEPLLVDRAEQLGAFERAMILSSRGERRDLPSRFLFPPIEDLATERLLEAPIRASWLVGAALGLSLLAAAAFLKGWPLIGLACLLLSTPLDLVASRIATLRLRPLATNMLSQRLLWPAAGIALISLGFWAWGAGGGWGALLAAIATAAFAQAARVEAPATGLSGEIWLFSRRNAIFAAIPFAIFDAWNLYLAAMALHASISFFLLQHVHHRVARN